MLCLPFLRAALQHWYPLWELALAWVLPPSRFTPRGRPFPSAGGRYGNIVATYLPQLPGPPLQRTGRVAASVLTTWLPAAAAALGTWALHRRQTLAPARS